MFQTSSPTLFSTRFAVYIKIVSDGCLPDYAEVMPQDNSFPPGAVDAVWKDVVHPDEISFRTGKVSIYSNNEQSHHCIPIGTESLFQPISMD